VQISSKDDVTKKSSLHQKPLGQTPIWLQWSIWRSLTVAQKSLLMNIQGRRTNNRRRGTLQQNEYATRCSQQSLDIFCWESQEITPKAHIVLCHMQKWGNSDALQKVGRRYYHFPPTTPLVVHEVRYKLYRCTIRRSFTSTNRYKTLDSA